MKVRTNDDETNIQQTEVYVLGMIHQGHRDSKLWGLEQVAQTIRSIDPDVVCPEIPPANWPAPLTTWREKHVVQDSRVRRLHQESGKAEWLTATLMVDQSRPGGFAWTAMHLPPWLWAPGP